MYYKYLDKMMLLLFMCVMANSVSAQRVYFKVGDNAGKLSSSSAALEMESSNKGFLLPRMSRQERNAIVRPKTSLIVWCTDCDSSTDPKSGQLCVWVDTRWIPVAMSKDYKN